MPVKIRIPKQLITGFCRRNHIRKLSLFGSVLRDDFTPESDVDVLVEFEPGHTPGLAFFAMQRELSGILGKNIDLNTAEDLSPYFRQEVLDEAEVLYVKA
jgi:predicted nucleotidyltransferase